MTTALCVHSSGDWTGRNLILDEGLRVTQPVSAVSGQGSALPWPAMIKRDADSHTQTLSHTARAHCRTATGDWPCGQVVGRSKKLEYPRTREISPSGTNSITVSLTDTFKCRVSQEMLNPNERQSITLNSAIPF